MKLVLLLNLFLKLSRKTWIALLLFFVSVLVFTRMDFLVHSTLYNYGLIFSLDWALEYWFLYCLLYQLVIVCLTLWTKNPYFFVAAQVFVFTATQDLVFFGLWEGWFPSGEWTWMLWYDFFGGWNTLNQIVLSVAANLAVLGSFVVVRLRSRIEW